MFVFASLFAETMAPLPMIRKNKDAAARSKAFSSEDSGFVDDVSGIEWEIVRQPSVDSAFERAYPSNSFRPQ